jgi:hypothetical protein
MARSLRGRDEYRDRSVRVVGRVKVVYLGRGATAQVEPDRLAESPSPPGRQEAPIEPMPRDAAGPF